VYKATPNQTGVRYLTRNKHQLLHRIQSVRTFTNLQYYHNVNIEIKSICRVLAAAVYLNLDNYLHNDFLMIFLRVKISRVNVIVFFLNS